MDTSTLTTHIQRFLDVPETDLLIQEQIEDHSRRQKKAAALLQTDRLQDVTPDKLHDLLEDTDA